MRFFERGPHTPSPTSERLPEQPKPFLDRIFKRKEKNRFKEGTYEHHLEEFKAAYAGRSLEELESMRGGGSGGFRDREWFDELPSPSRPATSTTEEVVPTAPEGYVNPEAGTPSEGLVDEFPEMETLIHEMVQEPTIEEARKHADAHNAGNVHFPGAQLDEETIVVPGQPYLIKVFTYSAADRDGNPLPGEDDIAVVTVENILPGTHVPEVVEPAPVDPEPTPTSPATPARRPSLFEDDPAETAENRNEERAEKDAIDFLYGRKLAEHAREGHELTTEQKKFLLTNLTDMGLNSALAELGAQRNGFTSFQQAARELKVKSGTYDNQKFLKMPESIMDRMPASVSNALKSARAGALTVAGLAIASLFAPPLIPVAIASAGGVVGSTLGRMLAGFFKRDRAIFGKGKEGGDSTAEAAFKGMTAQIASMRDLARRGVQNIEGAELSPEDLDKAYGRMLNQVIEGQLANEVSAVTAYRNKIKSARKVEAVASALGGMAGGMGASYAYSRWDALANGIRLNTDGVGESHLIKHVGGDWHQQLTGGDMAKGIHMSAGHPHAHTLTFFDGATGPDITGNISPAAQEAARVQNLDLFHVNGDWGKEGFHAVHGYFEGAVNKEILTRSIVPGLIGGAVGFLTGEASSYALSPNRRAKHLQERGMHGLTALHDDSHEVRNFNAPSGASPESTPATPEGPKDIDPTGIFEKGVQVTVPGGGEDNDGWTISGFFPDRDEVQVTSPDGATKKNVKHDELVKLNSEGFESVKPVSPEKTKKIEQNIEKLVKSSLSPEEINKLMYGESIKAPKGFPKQINRVLGFGDAAMKPTELILELRDALDIAVNKIDSLVSGKLSAEEQARAGDIKSYLTELQEMVKEDDVLSGRDRTFCDHIRFLALEKDCAAPIASIKGDVRFDAKPDMVALDEIMDWKVLDLVKDASATKDDFKQMNWRIGNVHFLLDILLASRALSGTDKARLENAKKAAETLMKMIEPKTK
ncbi:MAG TPA: hypothetical protein VLA04_05060 [Verrucomicrobiae bacterium]|nr:hypothetical protein [Verrucomicrobiae bacterium]